MLSYVRLGYVRLVRPTTKQTGPAFQTQQTEGPGIKLYEINLGYMYCCYITANEGENHKAEQINLKNRSR